MSDVGRLGSDSTYVTQVTDFGKALAIQWAAFPGLGRIS
jgi:hypothetical protein